MARVGGRNAAFAWVVGVGCLAILGVLAALALPLIPASMTWFGTTVDTAQGTSQTAPTSAPVAAGEEGALPTECPALYDEALWATMRFTRGAVLTPSKDAPVTTATALVSALSPDVQLTCFWHADAGTVSTTLATVPPDAGAIAAASLPGSGFTCESVDERTRCTRTDGDLTETIEAGGGLWLSTSESAWHPAGYVSRTGDRIWG
ncbi:hypothetical protein [Microbacterium lacticum]|uniref:Uncharacterized protein n=1 Tax=Microbacterium lacticum TaxID=33885 RepID=A0A4Y3UN40_9MICO|nr:hypothetical protein [Microbacterium lacticum]TQM90600.1 hypothetical protein FHX68_2921 [Microbacterium lacticum]GEB95534.1 hypothetical protein MLA01_17530 [Microbacterium lacticum]GGN22379.1 hypothetical protein GCM10009724_15810 [Microbacterium lacticum]